MDAIRNALEGKIGFQGQRLADRINQETLVMSAIVAFVVGWLADSLSIALGLFGASFLVALVACVPAWPMYKRYPEIWLPNRPPSADVDSVDAKKKQ